MHEYPFTLQIVIQDQHSIPVRCAPGSVRDPDRTINQSRVDSWFMDQASFHQIHFIIYIYINIIILIYIKLKTYTHESARNHITIRSTVPVSSLNPDASK